MPRSRARQEKSDPDESPDERVRSASDDDLPSAAPVLDSVGHHFNRGPGGEQDFYL